MVPLMVLTTGDARAATGWTLPVLSTADVSALIYWRRSADAKRLFSMAPWTLVGMAAGAGRWLVRRLRQDVFESLVLVLTGLCSLLLFF